MSLSVFVTEHAERRAWTSSVRHAKMSARNSAAANNPDINWDAVLTACGLASSSYFMNEMTGFVKLIPWQNLFILKLFNYVVQTL
jgi:hypothetical protein